MAINQHIYPGSSLCNGFNTIILFSRLYSKGVFLERKIEYICIYSVQSTCICFSLPNVHMHKMYDSILVWCACARVSQAYTIHRQRRTFRLWVLSKQAYQNLFQFYAKLFRFHLISTMPCRHPYPVGFCPSMSAANESTMWVVGTNLSNK